MEAVHFGRTAEGQVVNRYRLAGRNGAYADILNYGGVIQSLTVSDRRGQLTDVVLGFATVAEYEADEAYIGALVGRWAGRISGAAFTLDGVEYTLAANDGPNHLHGGRRGFNRRLWDAAAENGSLVLSRLSPDGEEGYPGNLSVRVKYTFDDRNQLTLDYEAKSDRDTIVNLTSHQYFNLNGAGQDNILDHLLAVKADCIAEIDSALIPTGRLLAIHGTPFDFNTPRRIGQAPATTDCRPANGGGYDHYFVRSQDRPDQPMATAFSPETGIRLEIFTTEPGLQFYTAEYLKECVGKGDNLYGPGSGFCLETQFWPDAVNQPAFPSAILRRGCSYRQITRYRFSQD